MSSMAHSKHTVFIHVICYIPISYSQVHRIFWSYQVSLCRWWTSSELFLHMSYEKKYEIQTRNLKRSQLQNA